MAESKTSLDSPSRHVPLGGGRRGILEDLTEIFYEVVPARYKTFCALTAAVIQRTLLAYGIAAERVPCQLWCATPQGNYVVGFLGKAAPGRWDGHAVCIAGDCLVDAALIHLRQDFSLPVPDLVVSGIFQAPTMVIGRFDLDVSRRLWWHRPPPQIDATLPEEPEEVVEALASYLVRRIREKQAARARGATRAGWSEVA